MADETQQQAPVEEQQGPDRVPGVFASPTPAEPMPEAKARAKLPDFKDGTLYDVQLTRQVEFPPGTGNYLRPGETHHFDGAVCRQLKDFISGAGNVPEQPGAA